MKEEALKVHGEVVKAADETLYDTGFADGQAGSQASGITQEQVDAARTEGKTKGLSEGEKIGFDKGVASVPVASADGKFTQAEMDKNAASKVEQAIAALPADTTPYSQKDVDVLKVQLTEAKAEAEKFQANDAAQEASIASFKGLISGIEALLHPVVATPELPKGDVKV